MENTCPIHPYLVYKMVTNLSHYAADYTTENSRVTEAVVKSDAKAPTKSRVTGTQARVAIFAEYKVNIMLRQILDVIKAVEEV